MVQAIGKFLQIFCERLDLARADAGANEGIASLIGNGPGAPTVLNSASFRRSVDQHFSRFQRGLRRQGERNSLGSDDNNRFRKNFNNQGFVLSIIEDKGIVYRQVIFHLRILRLSTVTKT